MQKITFRCGHGDYVPYLETTAEALKQARIARLHEGLCKQCWLKEQPVLFRLRPDGVVVIRGYPIRDDLRERGYYFMRPTWKKRFCNEAEREAEHRWIVDSVFEVETGT